jgi:tetratricopeptide (TPR) repeat protein
LWALAIFIGALVLRLIYFFQVKANFPGWDTPTIDPLYHDLWAKQIASGDLLGSGPFFRPPFYAYFLGFIYALAGPSLAVSKIIQHLAGSLSCLTIFLFADRYFNRRVAVLSGLISVFYWVFIYFEDELLLDSLLVLFSVILVWSLIRAAEKPALGRFFISGLMLGLAVVTRPNYLVVIPAVLLWMLIILPRQYKKAMSMTAAVIAGSLLFILPVTVRNAIVGDDLVLIASQGGINFYIGNNMYADGFTAVMPEFGSSWEYADCEYLAKKESGRLGQHMKQSEVSAFYYKKALGFIITEPSRWLGLMIRKLSYFWNRYEISNNQNLYFFRRFASVTHILPPLFFIISPLSILGLWHLFRKDRKYHIIGYFVLVYMLTVIGFFVNSRFRLPVMPFLIILAAMMIVRFYYNFRKRELRKTLVNAAALILLLLLTNIDFWGISRPNFAMSHFSLGNVYLKKGMNERALDEYSAALELADCVPSAHLNRGLIYFGRLDFEEAFAEFTREIEKCGRSAKAHNNLSVLYRLNGDADNALNEARLAISESPQNLEAHVNSILALRMLGADNAAYAVADSLTVIFPDYLPGHYFKGKFASERGNVELARSQFRLIISRETADILEKYDLSTIYSAQTPYGYKAERMPGLAYYELGLMEVSRGDIDSALVFFRAATEILPDYPDAWTNLALAYDNKKMYSEALGAFKKSTDLDPDNPVTLYNLGLTLGKVGLLKEATEAFQLALDLRPDFPEAREKLNITRSLLDSSSQ